MASNIPMLKDNVSAKAVTGSVDRSGVLREEQKGIAQFNQFLQTTIKQGAEIYDSKVYASESTKAQEELLNFMAESKSEKVKADYFKNNNGNMAGYSTYRAKKNMEEMEKKLSNVSHPKARKELEKQMAYQAQKTLLNDMGDENRIIQSLTQEKEVIKNQILASEIVSLKSPTDSSQYNISVTQRLADIQKATNDGLIDPIKAVKMRTSILDDAANLRARALVEGGNPMEALKSVRENRFGTLAQKNRTRDYVISKHLEGNKKGYELQKAQNDARREQIEAQTYEIDRQVQSIVNNPELNTEQKLIKTQQLATKYQGTLTSKQSKLILNASYETSRDAVSGILANVNSIPYDETNTAVFKGSLNRLRAITANTNYPAKVRKEASNALNKVIKKQKLHESAVERKAYDPLRKSKWAMDKNTHKNIINKIAENPKYENLPVEAEVEIYKLYAQGKDKKFIRAMESKVGGKQFSVKADKALELYRKDPEKFNKVILKGVKLKNSNMSQEQLKATYKKFKTDFDDYLDKVENFEQQEKFILDKYKGIN